MEPHDSLPSLRAGLRWPLALCNCPPLIVAVLRLGELSKQNTFSVSLLGEIHQQLG